MRILLARHAETVFNAGARMQGHSGHTPLTRGGIAQAEAMGAALAAAIPADEGLDIWASPAGRTLQTTAIVAEHLHRDFFEVRTDARLLEIDVGEWTGRLYADVVAERGPIHDPQRGVFSVRPPGGEWYPQIAARLRSWCAELPRDRSVLVVSHGVTLRVLRGLLAGGEPFEGVQLAGALPQGTISCIEQGVETLLHVGTGAAGISAA